MPSRGCCGVSARAAGAGLRPPHPLPSPRGAGERLCCRHRRRGKVPGAAAAGARPGRTCCGARGAWGVGGGGGADFVGGGGAAPRAPGGPAGRDAERSARPARPGVAVPVRADGRPGPGTCTTAARGRSPGSPRALPGKFLELLKMGSGIYKTPIPGPGYRRPVRMLALASCPSPQRLGQLRCGAMRSLLRARRSRGCTPRGCRTRVPESCCGEKGTAVPRLSGCVFLVSVGFWVLSGVF